jgi:hypothetical protein
MRSRCRADPRDGGTVTAELAVALPAVVLVLAACLGGLRLGTERLQATDAAALVARAAARGDRTGAIQAVRGDGGTVTGVVRAGDLVCATVRRQSRILGLAVPVSARVCALDETGG